MMFRKLLCGLGYHSWKVNKKLTITNNSNNSKFISTTFICVHCKEQTKLESRI